MPVDIEVPTWLKVMRLPAVASSSSTSWVEVRRRKVGTSIAGAAKSVVMPRLTAAGMRSDHMLRSPAANVSMLAATSPSAVVPPPVPPPVPVVPVPPMVSWFWKTRTGPGGLGIAPTAVFTGVVEASA